MAESQLEFFPNAVRLFAWINKVFTPPRLVSNSELSERAIAAQFEYKGASFFEVCDHKLKLQLYVCLLDFFISHHDASDALVLHSSLEDRVCKVVDLLSDK